MARGEDTGNHPGRQVGPHLSQNWKPVREGDVTGPLGTMFARQDPDDAGISMSAWYSPAGHHAEVEQSAHVALGGLRSGMEHSQYVAGPFRTARRARIAAESLGNRVASGAGAGYQRGSWFESRRMDR